MKPYQVRFLRILVCGSLLGPACENRLLDFQESFKPASKPRAGDGARAPSGHVGAGAPWRLAGAADWDSASRETVVKHLPATTVCATQAAVKCTHTCTRTADTLS